KEHAADENFLPEDHRKADPACHGHEDRAAQQHHDSRPDRGIRSREKRRHPANKEAGARRAYDAKATTPNGPEPAIPERWPIRTVQEIQECRRENERGEERRDDKQDDAAAGGDSETHERRHVAQARHPGEGHSAELKRDAGDGDDRAETGVEQNRAIKCTSLSYAAKSDEGHRSYCRRVLVSDVV